MSILLMRYFNRKPCTFFYRMTMSITREKAKHFSYKQVHKDMCALLRLIHGCL